MQWECVGAVLPVGGDHVIHNRVEVILLGHSLEPIPELYATLQVFSSDLCGVNASQRAEVLADWRPNTLMPLIGFDRNGGE